MLGIKGCSALAWHTGGFGALMVSAHQLRPGEMNARNGRAAEAMTAVGEADG